MTEPCCSGVPGASELWGVPPAQQLVLNALHGIMRPLVSAAHHRSELSCGLMPCSCTRSATLGGTLVTATVTPPPSGTAQVPGGPPGDWERLQPSIAKPVKSVRPVT